MIQMSEERLMKEDRNVTRRDVLKQGTLAAALTIGMPPVVARALEAARDPAAAAARQAAEGAKPVEPVRLAWIGTGVQGQNDLTQLVRLPGVQIVAIADIYDPNFKKGMEIAGKGCEG